MGWRLVRWRDNGGLLVSRYTIGFRPWNPNGPGRTDAHVQIVLVEPALLVCGIGFTQAHSFLFRQRRIIGCAVSPDISRGIRKRLQLTEGGETVRQGAAIAGQQQNVQSQIAAQSARDAIEQAGLDRRLDTTAANALQMAILNGDINAQQQLLEEAGLDRRQAATIRANMDAARMESQNALLRTLIGADAKGGGGEGDGRVAPRGTNNIGTSNALGTTLVSGYSSGIPHYTRTNQAVNPTARGTSTTGAGGGSTNRYNQYINQILRGYGLS